MDIELIKLFQQAGFTEKEARVYLALLELGKGDVTEIAKHAELKRSIVYVIVDELIEKGYVTKLPNLKINTYQAIDPAVIHGQIKTVSKHLFQMLPYLRSLQSKGNKKPKIHYLDSKEGFWKIYEEMSQYKTAWFISSYSRVEKHLPGSVDKWVGNHKKGAYPLKSKSLVPDTPEEIKEARKFLEAHQEVRVLPEIKNISMDFALYGNKLAITILEENPFLIIIESQDLVDSLVPIFEIAWKAGKEIK